MTHRQGGQGVQLKLAGALLVASFFLSGLHITSLATEGQIPTFMDRTYEGDVTVEVMAPQSSLIISSERGTAQVKLSPDGAGNVAIIGTASVNDEAVLRFDYLMRRAADGSWRDEGITVTPNGHLELMEAHEDTVVTAIGELNAASMTLHLRKARLDWAGTDDDTELDLAFTFDLSSRATNSEQHDAIAKCSTVVWQPRVIANIYGGSMSTVMVPVCSP